MLRFRRRFVSVCNVLKGIKLQGFLSVEFSHPIRVILALGYGGVVHLFVIYAVSKR